MQVWTDRDDGNCVGNTLTVAMTFINIVYVLNVVEQTHLSNTKSNKLAAFHIIQIVIESCGCYVIISNFSKTETVDMKSEEMKIIKENNRVYKTKFNT